MAEFTLRTATADDCDGIAAIYDHHARTGVGTFDLTGASSESWREKLASIDSRGWPFLVAEREGAILGFAYISSFRDRPAYAPCCEDSIYVAASAAGRGVGAALLGSLIDRARESGIRQMIAVIGGPEPASVALHRRCGFTESGRLVAVGEKFGRTLDVLLMQRSL
jgi:phosphinothricin acetyltransferase